MEVIVPVTKFEAVLDAKLAALEARVRLLEATIIPVALATGLATALFVSLCL